MCGCFVAYVIRLYVITIRADYAREFFAEVKFYHWVVSIWIVHRVWLCVRQYQCKNKHEKMSIKRIDIKIIPSFLMHRWGKLAKRDFSQIKLTTQTKSQSDRSLENMCSMKWKGCLWLALTMVLSSISMLCCLLCAFKFNSMPSFIRFHQFHNVNYINWNEISHSKVSNESLYFIILVCYVVYYLLNSLSVCLSILYMTSVEKSGEFARSMIMTKQKLLWVRNSWNVKTEWVQLLKCVLFE